MLPAHRTTLPGQPATASQYDTRTPIQNWRTAARCVGIDPRLFDPLDADDPARQHGDRLRRARGVCDQCPVATRCLVDALKHRDVGVRGGLLLSRPGDTTARIIAHRIADTNSQTQPEAAA